MTRAIGEILAGFARREPKRLLAGLALTLATIGASAGLLFVSGRFITGTALAGLGLILAFDTFGPSAAVRFFAVTRTVARYVERLSTHDATLRFLTGLRVDAFRGTTRGDTRHARPGALFNRLSGDLDALDGLVIRLAIPLAAAILLIAGVGLALSAVDPLLAAAVVLPLAIGGLAVPFLSGRAAARSTRRRLHALDAARLRFIDLDRGRGALVADGRYAGQIAAVSDAFQRARSADRSLARIDALLRAGAALGAQGAVLGALAAGAPMVAAGRLDGLAFAGLAVFAFALGEVVAPFRSIALDLGRWSIAAGRIAPLVRAGAASTAGAGTPADGETAPRVLVEGLRVGPGRARLSAVDLDIAAGERIGLIGRSGSGKSTLIAAIAGWESAAAGRITITPPAFAGWLGQRTDLFRGSVAENLRLALPEASDADLDAAIRAVRLESALGSAGTDLMLGDGGGGLSGGERRRLALARLLLRPGGLVLLDEPTEGLDEATAEAVLAALLDRTAGRTLVLATHRRSEAAAMDRLVLIDAGRIVREARAGEPGFSALLTDLRR